jgi:tetratricopeptide (TPR) repeat protein
MSIEALKEQARRHEQKEEWQKALDQYNKAIAKLAEDDQPDIGLYNRVGDLHVRVGQLDQAVEAYGQAVDLYMEAFLPNNAIAVCKKIIRNVPERHQAYLRMGQIRGEQGFIPDARTNFLTYAERMQQAGDLDESFRALVEFCDLAPEEVDVRLVVADQMASHERVDDAIEQLSVAYRQLMTKGDSAQVAEVEAKIRELDPNADLDAGSAMAGATAGGADPMASFGDVELGAETDTAEEESGSGEIQMASFDIGSGDDAEEEAEEAAELPMMAAGDEEEEGGFDFDISTGGDEAEEEEEEATELPTFDLGEEEEESEAAELPMMDLGAEGEEEEEEVATELPTFDLGEEEEEEEEEEEVAELPMMDLGADEAEEEAEEEEEEAAQPEKAQTLNDVRASIASEPDDVGLRQRMVELAYLTGDDAVIAEAFLGLAETLDRAGEASRAQAAYQQVLQSDPGNEVAQAALGREVERAPVREVAANQEYVDLGSLLLGDEEEKTTRFVVAYEEPSGDEEADFSKMLSQFKEKVSENLDVDDVRAHHDLGTAYKEMGLLDEAISEFQAALRASAAHLPTYELMGQTFLEMGKADAAVKSLERALQVDHDIEDDMVGIYYYLARAYEQMESTDQAVEFYDRVFSLDINFADVTERLRALR